MSSDIGEVVEECFLKGTRGKDEFDCKNCDGLQPECARYIILDGSELRSIYDVRTVKVRRPTSLPTTGYSPIYSQADETGYFKRILDLPN